MGMNRFSPGRVGVFGLGKRSFCKFEAVSDRQADSQTEARQARGKNKGKREN